MQVNAISAKVGISPKVQCSGCNAPETKVTFKGEDRNNVSNNAITNATKALALAMMLSMGTAGLTSCDKMNFDETHIYPVEIPVDTVKEVHYYPIPGCDRVDTVKIKPGYDSPVAPVIKKFFENDSIDTGDGKIPVRMVYLDEYKHPYVKSLFNEDKSSKNEMWYNVTTTDFDDDEGKYVEGKNENFYQLGYSTPDGKNQLVVKLLKLRNPNLDKNNELNYKPVSTAMYDVSTGNRYTIDEDGNAEYDGKFEKGDLEKSIIFTNKYDAVRRYSSIEVNSVTPKDVPYEDKK